MGLTVLVYELWRIDKAGFVLEGVWNCGAMPACIDESDPTYTKYYRQKRFPNDPPSVSEPPALKQKGKTTV